MMMHVVGCVVVPEIQSWLMLTLTIEYETDENDAR